MVRALAATAANGNTVHHVALLGLVSKTMCLVSTSRAADSLDLVTLAVLPSAVNMQESGEILIITNISSILTEHATKSVTRRSASFATALQGICRLPSSLIMRLSILLICGIYHKTLAEM